MVKRDVKYPWRIAWMRRGIKHVKRVPDNVLVWTTQNLVGRMASEKDDRGSLSEVTDFSQLVPAILSMMESQLLLAGDPSDT